MKVKTTVFKRSRLGFAITAVCLGTTTSVVQAQDSSAPVSAEETVTVVGQAARLRTSLNQQRMSDNLQTIVTSDSINSLPDANVSESLQRLPGISIERDQDRKSTRLNSSHVRT